MASLKPVEEVSRDEEVIEQQQELSEGEEDFLDEVIMALDLRDRGTIGCAYYLARQEKLYVMGDIKAGSMETIDARQFISPDLPPRSLPSNFALVITYVNPTIILLSLKVDENVENRLNPGNQSREAREISGESFQQ